MSGDKNAQISVEYFIGWINQLTDIDLSNNVNRLDGTGKKSLRDKNLKIKIQTSPNLKYL
jgi:hypothetical protein